MVEPGTVAPPEYLGCVATPEISARSSLCQSHAAWFRRALYNNLKQGADRTKRVAETFASYGETTKDPLLTLAISIDETIKRVRPDGWRGVQAREQVIKAALYNILQNVDEVERIFLIIKQQKEY